MNIEDVKTLVGLFDKSSAAYLEYGDGGTRLVLSKNAAQSPPGDFRSAAQPPAQYDTAAEDGVTLVTSPVVGTLYRAKAPGEEPFVKKGVAVSKGDVLCLVEAMKMFNEITAPCDGVVKDILFEDGDMAEHGMSLFKIGKAQ